MSKTTYYFDNAATTPVRKEVLDAMMPFFTENYGNASSIYEVGARSKNYINEARKIVSDAIGCYENELFFTASGSEADNWAIKGVAYSKKSKGNHIITSAIEHHAVLHTLEFLEKQGYEVTYLPVDEYGQISLDDLKNAIKDSTILITIMYANNEIGTIEPIKEIAKIAKEHNVIFHTDAVQAVGAVPINVHELGVDMLSLSGHKFNGPKGVGALYIKKGLRIDNLIHGGAQESNRRAGTENTPGIIGLAKAIELATTNLNEKIERVSKLRDYTIKEIEKRIPYCRLNGHRTDRLCGNVNFSFRFIEGESLLLMLDLKGVAASSGSACTSGSLDPSHVLLAIGLPHEIAHGSLRISIGYQNTKEEIDYLLDILPPIVERLRQMSPLYDEIKGDL
ncbi:MAG: cysteine desulfurase NifS [Ruminococcaceae bacterium]|nr:cysteine desulfurase NifS [Oscillospiraceae bacterium]